MAIVNEWVSNQTEASPCDGRGLFKMGDKIK